MVIVKFFFLQVNYRRNLYVKPDDFMKRIIMKNDSHRIAFSCRNKSIVNMDPYRKSRISNRGVPNIPDRYPSSCRSCRYEPETVVSMRVINNK
jgi:hypothetical protein